MEKLKQVPFNAELYFANPDKYKLECDGEEVTKFTNFEATDYPLHGVIGNELVSWTLDGHYFKTDCISAKNLTMYEKVQVKESWVNVYEAEGGVFWAGDRCSSKETAERYKSNGKYICTIPLHEIVEQYKQK